MERRRGVSGLTYMLPFVPDEGSVAEEILQGEVIHIGPGGGVVPGDLQTLDPVGYWGDHHLLWGVRFH